MLLIELAKSDILLYNIKKFNEIGGSVMSITVRSYTDKSGYSDDFNKVCEFLIRINKNNIVTSNFL